MKLLTLLKDLPSHTLTGSPQVKISHLECDSRRILPGSCYIALKGTRADGHEFIPEAIRRGACAVVAEMFIPILSGRPMMWWTMAWEKKSWTLYPREIGRASCRERV